jgi:hypothetical protein
MLKKVEVIQDTSSKTSFENIPKLFSKWTYEDIKV